MKRLLFGVALFLSHLKPASALLPESGFYWNPAFPGTGYAVEFQDDFMFMTAYTYQQAGSAVFFTIQGVLNVNTNVVSGVLTLFEAGSCLGCPFVPPRSIPVAPAEVRFLSNRTGVIRIHFPNNLVEIPVTRFVFALDDGSPSGELLGSWIIAAPLIPSASGDLLFFMSKISPPTGYDAAFEGGSSAFNRSLVGGRFAGTNTWIVLIDSSPSTFRRIIFSAPSPNRWFGKLTVYLKTDSPPPFDSGFVAFATRLTGRRTIDQIAANSGSSPKSDASIQESTDILLLDAVASADADPSKGDFVFEDEAFMAKLREDPQFVERMTLGLQQLLKEKEKEKK